MKMYSIKFVKLGLILITKMIKQVFLIALLQYSKFFGVTQHSLIIKSNSSIKTHYGS